jgi:hypothetical protein
MRRTLRWADFAVQQVEESAESNWLLENGKLGIGSHQPLRHTIGRFGHENDLEFGDGIQSALGQLAAVHPRHGDVGKQEANLRRMSLEIP